MSGIVLKKKCNKCGKMLPRTIKYFYKHKGNKDGLMYVCKECWKKHGRDYGRTERGKFVQKNSKLKRDFGITFDEYKKILKSQGNACAICGKPQDNCKKWLDVDHNHVTKFIRGILCNYCNGWLLKHLRDNKKRAIGLVRYLTDALKNDKDWK